MAQARTTGAMSQGDAACLAGLIDREGTVTLARRHRHENRRIPVSICNTEIALAAQRTTGLGVISQKRRSSAHHTQAYVWAVWGRQALDILREAHPWMRSCKAERAALALSEHVALMPRIGKYTAKQWEMRKSFEKRLLALSPQCPHSSNLKW